MSNERKRPEFRQWVDGQEDPQWEHLPLTHTCKSLVGLDICREGKVTTSECDILERPAAYFFYGRPAYRVKGDGPIKSAAACPMCLLFNPAVLSQASEIFPFDTGAFSARLYKHAMMDEMQISDFSMESRPERIRKLIEAVHKGKEKYFRAQQPPTSTLEEICSPSEFLARAYLDLISSVGRNEPDDRVGTIEVVFDHDLRLDGALIAAFVPDIIWNDNERPRWIIALADSGVDIVPFRYSPGREPAYYQAMIESEVEKYLRDRGDF